MQKDNCLNWRLGLSVLVLLVSPLISADFTPVADTYIICSGTYDNYGGDEYVYVRQVSPTGGEGWNRHGYLKFDISSYSGSIDTARLHLNVLRATTTDNATPVTAHFWLLDDGDDGWDEMAINWSNAPAKWDSVSDQIVWTNTPGTSLFFFTFGFHEETDPDTTYVFDVTDAVAVDANGIISFFIADTARNKTKIYLHTKENTVGSDAAMLEIKAATVSTDDSELLTPSTFSLHQNYPNPFNPETRIGYTVNNATDVTITVFNLLGEEVTTLLSDYVSAGEHSVVWNGTNMENHSEPTGVYFCQMTGSNCIQTIKMLLMK